VARKISRKHEFWISDYAYLELKYFCLRYKEYENKYSNRRELIEQTALETDSSIYQSLLINITTGATYEQIIACGIKILCGRRQFYEKRKKFFWILDSKNVYNAYHI